MDLLSENKCFAGTQYRYQHQSAVLDCPMHFSIFVPDVAKDSKVPVLYWLSGLTCTDENFVNKAGAQKAASELGIAIVAPDTSPRGEGVPDDPDGAYDLGMGAGFYLNATAPPWKEHYQMYDYIVSELPELIARYFPLDAEAQSISGHSMGGHGALTIALKNPDRYKSVSAFAPICAPMQCPWGIKALSSYLGDDQSSWSDYDATQLIARTEDVIPILIDQGESDQFLGQQLHPHLFLSAAKDAGIKVDYRLRPGFDHSYFYIATFIAEHLAFHHQHLK